MADGADAHVFEAHAEDDASWSQLPMHEMGLTHLRDVTFLRGQAPPVAVALAEQTPTFPGRLPHPSLTCTCELSAFSLSVPSGRATRIWRAAGLPSDAHTLVALPEPPGGVLVIADSSLLWLSYAHRCGVALNADACTGAVRLSPAGPHGGHTSVCTCRVLFLVTARPVLTS